MQTAINIIVLASIYALISCGYVLIYKVSRVLNLAHGELMLLGAYLLLAVSSNISPDPWLAVTLAAGLSIVVGLLVYVLLMRKMTGESVLAAVLTTIAFGILLRGVMILVWSPQQHNIAKPLGIANSAIEILPGARISSVAATLVLVTVLVYAALFAFLRLSRWGMRMRAAGQNPLLAAQRGIELHIIYALAWGLSTFTGATAGMLIAMDSRLDSTMVMIGLKAFPAALVGGLDSLFGAIIGSLIIAGAEVLMIQWVNPLLSDVVPFFVLIAMLAIRPWGLFGTREKLDRV
ncbi:branched-chain amino acid ABC transporter permease [Pseudorhodoplanes sp.]|uniref:branched-chain amino acid ABC transporter permease n=1 Tax=Pseudorhodoplanes sp. TaxID=1934341 RepID=UPI003D0B665A